MTSNLIEYGVIQARGEIIVGAPVFQGTRVPVQMLFDYLNENETIGEFLADFPAVKKEQVRQLLDHLRRTAIKVNFAA